MSLIGLIKQGDWQGAARKIESIFVQDVVDPVEVFAEQFLTDFGKFALQEASTYVPQLLSGATTIPVAGAQILADSEKEAVSIAEKDALAVAQNALRVQLTATCAEWW